MKRVSSWAHAHIALARFLVTILHLFLAILSIYIGILLSKNGIHVPLAVFWSAVIVFSISWLSRKHKIFTSSYYRRKSFDIFVILVSVIMIAASSNRNDARHFIFYSPLQGSLITEKSNQTIYKKIVPEPEPKKEQGASAGAVVLSIFLSIVVAYFTAALSCNASCNGNDALAVLIMILGLVGIFFMVRAILRASKRNRNKQAEAATAVPSS